MRYDLLIRDVAIVTESGVAPATIGIVGDKIEAIGPDLAGNATDSIYAGGLHAFPGLIDIHVHFNDPGRADWEGVATGSAALAAGGGTCFFDMPLNSSPPVIDAEAFNTKSAALAGNSFTDYALWGGLVPGNLDHMTELADLGVVGFKAFMSNSGIDDFSRADDLTLYRGMQQAAKLGLPVAVHAESDELTGRLTAEARTAGRTRVRDYLNSRPIMAEVIAIQRAILFACETGCDLHVVHVSSAKGVRAVLDAEHLCRDGRPRISCETCPHYLALTDDDVQRLGAIAKCAPPLRSASESDALWQQVLNGSISLISSDHSPAPRSMKDSTDFFAVWGGIAGVQSTLNVLLTRQPALPLQRIAQLTAGVPASLFNIAGKGRLAVGCDADLTLVELGPQFTLQRKDLLDRHKLSPYVGRTFTGVVRRTLLRGKTIFADGKLSGPPHGRLIKPLRASVAPPTDQGA